MDNLFQNLTDTFVFLGTGGKANYAFVGLKNAGKNISTFHVKKVKDLAKIPSLGFFY